METWIFHQRSIIQIKFELTVLVYNPAPVFCGLFQQYFNWKFWKLGSFKIYNYVKYSRQQWQKIDNFMLRKLFSNLPDVVRKLFGNDSLWLQTINYFPSHPLPILDEKSNEMHEMKILIFCIWRPVNPGNYILHKCIISRPSSPGPEIANSKS